VIGSYAPQTAAYTFSTQEEIAPSGFIARGGFSAKGKVMDDDKNIHAEFEYSFEIKSDWT